MRTSRSYYSWSYHGDLNDRVVSLAAPIAKGEKTRNEAEEMKVRLNKLKNSNLEEDWVSKDTTIYLTQSRWDDKLAVLKESIMPADKKMKFLEIEDSEYEKAIDFAISSRTDVFVLVLWPYVFKNLLCYPFPPKIKNLSCVLYNCLSIVVYCIFKRNIQFVFQFFE